MYLAGYGIKRNFPIAFQSETVGGGGGRHALSELQRLRLVLISFPPSIVPFLCVFRLFVESSDRGDRDAMAHLAAMYLQGVGAPKKDIAKAIEWYTNAAERGHVRAQAILAVRILTHRKTHDGHSLHLSFVRISPVSYLFVLCRNFSILLTRVLFAMRLVPHTGCVRVRVSVMSIVNSC